MPCEASWGPGSWAGWGRRSEPGTGSGPGPRPCGPSARSAICVTLRTRQGCEGLPVFPQPRSWVATLLLLGRSLPSAPGPWVGSSRPPRPGQEPSADPAVITRNR